MRERLRIIGLVFQLHLKQTAIDPFVLFSVVFQPLIVALLAIYMLRDTEGFDAIYVIVGSAMTGLWTGTLFFSAFNVRFERWTGVLEYIVGSPTSLATVITGKSLANTVLSLNSIILGYALALFFFGFDLSISNPPAFFASLALAVVALVAMGLVIAPFMALNIGADAWVNSLESPMFIFGGFLFPIAILPNWLTPVSYTLAPYWAARALHGTSSGNAPTSEILFSWGWLLVLSLIYLLSARWLFDRLLYKARVDATLGIH